MASISYFANTGWCFCLQSETLPDFVDIQFFPVNFAMGTHRNWSHCSFYYRVYIFHLSFIENQNTDTKINHFLNIISRKIQSVAVANEYIFSTVQVYPLYTKKSLNW